MKLASRALISATAIGTVLQVAMVLIGHHDPAVMSYFAAGGLGISFVAGVLYAVLSTEVVIRDNITGGLIAGGVSAFIGISVSWWLHDVPGMLLLVGTAGSLVTGAIGGWVGRLFSSGRV
ncbi:MAG: hypothetical protein ACREL5_01090 [Gemmatimonadales bacterium]